MAYKHGVYTSEVATSMVAPITGTAGLQVIVGTAPVNMLKDPAAAVNVPLLVNSYKEAVEAVGYLPDFANYTLCECISANFSVVGIAPMVLINVLDPAKHKIAITGGTVQVNDGVAGVGGDGRSAGGADRQEWFQHADRRHGLHHHMERRRYAEYRGAFHRRG